MVDVGPFSPPCMFAALTFSGLSGPAGEHRIKEKAGPITELVWSVVGAFSGRGGSCGFSRGASRVRNSLHI